MLRACAAQATAGRCSALHKYIADCTQVMLQTQNKSRRSVQVTTISGFVLLV